MFFCHMDWKIRGSHSALGDGGRGVLGSSNSVKKGYSVSIDVKAKAYQRESKESRDRESPRGEQENELGDGAFER